MTLYLERVGRTTDVWINVAAWGGKEGMTVSEHAALDRQVGKTAGCIVCAILGLLVERNHCAKTLDPLQPTSAGAAVRAGLAMIAGFWMLGLAISAVLSRI